VAKMSVFLLGIGAHGERKNDEKEIVLYKKSYPKNPTKKGFK
jgi:hypothetical protein